jgi:uncharacterized protein
VIRRIARYAAALVAAASSLLSVALFAAGEVPKAPTRWVTDGAAFLSEPTRQGLDARLQAYEQQTGHQVLIWIGRTTDGVPIEDFAVKAFKAWGVGRQGQDDGLVLFLFADDRTVRFEVGYGLEGAFPDIAATRIIREVLTPRLQAGDRDGAVLAAIEAATATISGDESASGVVGPEARGRGRGQPQPLTTAQKVVVGLVGLAFLFILFTNPALALFLLHVIASGAGRGGGGGGGGWSGGGGRSGGGGASGSW